MITVGMNYRVLPGKNQQFESVFKSVIELMADMPGHSKTQLLRDVFDSQNYVVVSDWSDRAAFDAFVRSEQFRSVANWGKEQILEGRPTHDYYEK